MTQTTALRAQKIPLRSQSLLIAGVLLATALHTLGGEPAAARFAERSFGALARLQALPEVGAEAATAVQQVTIGDKVAGWVFRTDRLPPVARGKRGEIATWVALGADGKIIGIDVAKHREDREWFNRLKKPFYRQFEGLAADGSARRPDAVATATISSKAIIDDVMGACAAVLELPAVKGVLAPAPAAAPDAAR